MRLPTAIPAVAATLTVVAPEAVLPVVVVLFALKNALTSEPTVVTSVLADLHQATFKLLPHAPGVLAAHEPRPELHRHCMDRLYHHQLDMMWC